ncbi:outer membrane protein assembly factor BamD [Akkermansiaceae bacterium]|nr:outer membrane protein assembly factor BamD [Akkermansiaceae bacterium]
MLTANASLAAGFDEQRATISASPATQPEAAILSLLKSGIEEAKPAQAIAEAEKWLRQNLPKDAMLLFHAARAAELSGDAPGAAALYEQFLRKADPTATETGQAIIAVHSLFRDQLNDPGAAYSFNRSNGDRLATNTTARQFDAWFLNEAATRKDVIAVANRLHAIAKAGIPADLWVTSYERHLRWLLAESEVYCEQPGVAPSTDESVAAGKQLANAAMSFNEELALRLDWAVSVRAYNLAKIADQNPAPPLAEAKALLAKFPHHAALVQNGWAGGGNGQHYRNDPAKYWPHESDAKMAPIVGAAAKLNPLDLADLMATWRNGYFSDRVVRPLAVKSVRDFLAAKPDATNSRTGLLLSEKPWNELTPAEAAALAPKCAALADPEASLIRAVAAGGEAKDLEKMIAALLGPESWRLGAAELDGRSADQLWHYAGRPGANQVRDAKIAESKALAAQVKAAALKKDAPAPQRLAQFTKLWADYKSPQPKIPAVVSRLRSALLITPEAMPELLKDRSVDARLLARNAIAEGIAGPEKIWTDLEIGRMNLSKYEPWIQALADRRAGRSLSELKKRNPEKYVPHPLEPVLRESVATGLKQNSLDPWQLIAWVNMQYPEDNAAQISLAQEIAKSPAWKTLNFEARFALREWFGKSVASPGELGWLSAADPALVCKDLLALTKESDAASAVTALTKAIDGIGKSPIRMEVNAAQQIASLDAAVFSDPKVFALILGIAEYIPETNEGNELFKRVFAQVRELRDPVMIQQTASIIWPYVSEREPRSQFAPMTEFIESLMDEHPNTAYALARRGVDSLTRARDSYGFEPRKNITGVKAQMGKSAMQLGLVTIPVAKNHPAYPVYQSQGDWLMGNEDSAWALLDENWDSFLPVYRELTVPFLKWILQRTIYGRDEERQETLIKALLGWAGEAGSPLTPLEKAEFDIAYGDIAMQRGQLRQAHEIYARAQTNEAYAELSIRHQAALRKAAAERIARNFDGALQTLNDLELERIPEIWTEIRYARAEVYYDMEEFDDAKDDIDSILSREPNHADSKILLGKVQLKRQKLMEATEVELGSAASQKTLFPGEKLKVTLVDPTLAVSGAGTEIEVVVWATSGDKEQFFLRQFGDQKTKFRGEVPTALGAPAPGDNILQVIGDDEVFYAYSERFREKMNNIAEKRGGPITVASDAILMASARKLLTEAEQRTADMQATMDAIKGKVSGDVTAAARAEMAAKSLSAEARKEGGGISEEELGRYLTDVAKPGNPIHVRVIDPDRSRTGEIDELTVSVSSSSGDSVSQVTLRETGTHSGWFEGSIPTTGAQALAFAKDSEPGRNPNMVISPAADTYPAWRPVAGQEAPDFRIDLNDNSALGEMTITAREKGAALKSFMLQTGMNDGDMTTVAVFPREMIAPKSPWAPSVTVMNDADSHHNRDARSVYDIHEIREHMERGWITQKFPAGIAENVAGPSQAMTGSIPGKVKWQREGRHHNSHVIYRFRGYFYERSDVVRRFKLELGNYQVPKGTHPSVSNPPQFMLAVNGRPITNPEMPNRLEGEAELRPGLHSFEIWATGWDCAIGFGRSIKLLANLEDAETLVDCPDAFFDPTTFPEGTLDQRNSPATITANGDGTEFKVAFAPDSRARLLRLVFLDNEGKVPALNKLALTNPEGKAILPVAEDFAELNKNDTLEMLTGDKIAVRYVDDRFVTKAKERQERSLSVSFTNAYAEFADMKPRFDSRLGEDKPYYEKLLRFQYDKPLSLAVHDADMDVSVQPDKVKVKVGGREFEATETGDSTGVFELVVTPVSGTATGNQVQVAEGGTITASYTDQENNRPGVPTERIATIAHAVFTAPQIKLSHATVAPAEGEAWRTLIHGFERRTYMTEEKPDLASEAVRPRWLVENRMVASSQPPEGGIEAVLGRRMYLELIVPHLALGTSSDVTVYAQADSGRARAAASAGGFDISVPGTIALTATTGQPFVTPGLWSEVPSLEIYEGGTVANSAEPQYDRFKLSVPLVAGLLPPYGALSHEERNELRKQAKTSRAAADALERGTQGLITSVGEKIHFGFQYTDAAGEKQWLTASAKVIAHPVFDVLQEDYRSPMTSAYVGENLNLRVVDLGADVSDAADTVSVLVQSKAGEKHPVELRESGPHTGIFKAAYQLSYAGAKREVPAPTEGEPAPYDVRREGFPVAYGDTVAARYTDANGVKTETAMVTISKGADGSIRPFSKTYDDAEIAMRTQFSLAEAYLEMAKRHRLLGQTEMAEIEYASAKQLLSKAMDQFTDPDTRAHAEYLLGNLTMEEADTTEEADLKETRYRAALSRFLSVTGSYPQTLHASKAQYRIATLYERLGEPDIAAQEYVKLAYKYPDSEYLATSMARLGSHFLKAAAAYEAQAKPLLAKEDDKDAVFEGEALQKMAVREYLKTAQIFGRLQERFPSDELAGQAGLRCGQAYMRADKKQEAVAAFQRVIAEESYDGPEIRAQAIYWTGMCYLDLSQQMAAYSSFKRLTYDFPESKWAAYARGQLSQESLLNLESKLELERLENEQ